MKIEIEQQNNIVKKSFKASGVHCAHVSGNGKISGWNFIPIWIRRFTRRNKWNDKRTAIQLTSDLNLLRQLHRYAKSIICTAGKKRKKIWDFKLFHLLLSRLRRRMCIVYSVYECTWHSAFVKWLEFSNRNRDPLDGSYRMMWFDWWMCERTYLHNTSHRPFGWSHFVWWWPFVVSFHF